MKSVISEDEEPAEAGGGKAQKPEVLCLIYHGAEYKCWATSEAEMAALVHQISQLQREHAMRVERNSRRSFSFSSADRQMTAAAAADRDAH